MDFFKEYFEYAGAGESEPPNVFHRWAAIGIIGALVGRKAYIRFGHSKIYPNQYIMFMGTAGSRKSTAINIGAKLAQRAGYTRFAADRSSKERFLMDMKQVEDSLTLEQLDVLTLNEPSEVFVVAEEFTDFTGNNNMEFITTLTKLWDCPAQYVNPKIHGKSVTVHEPTVNILSGNTPQNFALAFPPEALGNGFLSRLIFIHGQVTGRKVTFPKIVDELLLEILASHLKEMREVVTGEMKMGRSVELLCDKIYNGFVEIDDNRFKNYSTRRFTHLLKLALVIAAADLSTEIKEEHILKANTALHFAEIKMPQALGEYGKSKYSDVSTSVMEIINKATMPVDLIDLWKKVGTDVDKRSTLGDIVNNLLHAGKIQQMTIKNKTGFLALKQPAAIWDEGLIIPEWLTNEER